MMMVGTQQYIYIYIYIHMHYSMGLMYREYGYLAS
jgi:hypothetical protein